MGRAAALAVTPAEVAAAQLQVKRARQRGRTVDPAVEAIANAQPLSSLVEDVEEVATPGTASLRQS
jgi:hypothetical protein